MCWLIVRCEVEGEIFEAIAALTHADCSAKVTAETACASVTFPKDQFISLIKKYCGSTKGLFMALTNCTVNLNKPVIGPHGDRHEHRIGS